MKTQGNQGNQSDAAMTGSCDQHILDCDGDRLLDHAAGRYVQTLARVFDAIRQGCPPWVAFNEFLHEWYDYAKDERQALVATPIAVRSPSDVSADVPDLWRWAVFCAAAAEFLCDCCDVPRPAWSEDPVYVLDNPWYGFGEARAQLPEVRTHLEQTTPPALRWRNLVAGGRVFANKYEFAAQVRALRGRVRQESDATGSASEGR